MNWESFLRWEQQSRDIIDFKTVYVDIAGDILAGLLLSQIIYWHLPGRNNQNRLKVERDGRLWIARAHKDWWDEIRLTQDQVRRALGILQEKGLVIVERFKFAGTPTTHISLNKDLLIAQMNLVNSPDGNGPQPESKWATAQMEMGHNPLPLTEITTEITTETTYKGRSAPASEQIESFKVFWEQYPRKQSKQAAWGVWKKLKPDQEILQKILEDLIWRKSNDRQWIDDDGQFIPHPSTYLNQRRWEDERPTGKAVAPVRQAQGETRSSNQEFLLNRMRERAAQQGGVV